MKKERHNVGDTITITPDGRGETDVNKLLAKPHIQEMMRMMQAKTRYVTRPPRPVIYVLPPN